MAVILNEICIDCADPKSQAEWWAQVLDWPLQMDESGLYWWMTRTGQPQDGPILVFVGVPEPKTVKNRIHLDLNPFGADQAEELERLLSLGAKRIDVGQGEVPWVVLSDPEGNEFCLLGRRVG